MTSETKRGEEVVALQVKEKRLNIEATVGTTRKHLVM
jgi:hypothetical protein